MKKLLLLSVLAGLLAAPVFAQDSKEKEKDKQKEYAEWQNKVKEELKLTNDQVARWAALKQEYKQKMDGIAEDGTVGKELSKEEKAILKKEREAKFMELLTPQQQAKYKELLDAKKNKQSDSRPVGS